MPRLIISISNKELDALVKLAQCEMRDPREQMRFILRQELLEHQLLDDDHQQITKPGECSPQSGSSKMSTVQGATS